MSVIQQAIAEYTEAANHLDHLGLQGDARQARSRAASLSEYADITEARAAGFATVEEMTRQMGRSDTVSVADFLNSMHDVCVEYEAMRQAIPIPDLDKLTIKDGDVVRSADEADRVRLRIHEELDDAPPPPTDAQQCTAHLLNYLDSKFKESSDLQIKLHEESTGNLTRVNSNVIGSAQFFSVCAFIGFGLAFIGFVVKLVSLP